MSTNDDGTAELIAAEINDQVNERVMQAIAEIFGLHTLTSASNGQENLRLLASAIVHSAIVSGEFEYATKFVIKEAMSK